MVIHAAMALTRLFRNGHSQAVRIPAELAYERNDLELEIERIGDELRIRPAGRPITEALEALASFSPSFLAAGRGEQEQQETPTPADPPTAHPPPQHRAHPAGRPTTPKHPEPPSFLCFPLDLFPPFRQQFIHQMAIVGHPRKPCFQPLPDHLRLFQHQQSRLLPRPTSNLRRLALAEQVPAPKQWKLVLAELAEAS